MALVLADRTKETTTTTGTGSLSLSGAVTGYAAFGDSLADGDTTYYAISTALGSEWEVGLGTYATSGTTLARTTIFASSNSGAAVNFSAGTKDVYIVNPADKQLFLDASGHLDIPNNVTIGGDLTVTGTTTSINVEQLDVSDNLIHIAHDNTGDVTDFGWVGHFNDGTDNHAGIFRDASDGKFYIFDNFTASELTGATVDRGDPSFSLATLVGGTFEGAVIGNVTGNVTGNLTGNADTATTLATARTISLSGDVAGSVSFNGSANVDIAATVQANSVALGTDTTGNYMSGVTAGSGIDVSHTPGEGSSATISHTDTSTQASVNNSGNTFIQDITLDTYGHITGLASATAVINDGTLTMGTSGVGLSGSATFTANDSDNVTYTVTSNATANNTASTIVARDASGNFTAGTITANLSGNVTGNADTATTLAATRSIGLGGDLSGSANFNGSADITITATVANDSHTHDGRYFTETESDARFAAIAGNSSQNFSANLIKLSNLEKSNLSADGDLGFDSSQGLLVYRTQQGVTGAVTVLDGANVNAGSGITITNLNAGATGSESIDFSLTADGRIGTGDRYYGNTSDYMFCDADVGLRFYSAGAEDMRLTDAGDLHVDNDVIAFSTTISDVRLKDDVSPITNALNMVNSLTGYTFTYKADGKKSAGVIAQEVEKVLPVAVSEKELPLKTDDDQKYKVVNYDALHGILIEAVKELTARVVELESKVK